MAGGPSKCIDCDKPMRGKPYISLGTNTGGRSKVCVDCTDKTIGYKSGHTARLIKTLQEKYRPERPRGAVTTNKILAALDAGQLTREELLELLMPSS